MKFVRVVDGLNHLTALELQKLNSCKAYLKANGVFVQDSFVVLTDE